MGGKNFSSEDDVHEVVNKWASIMSPLLLNHGTASIDTLVFIAHAQVTPLYPIWSTFWQKYMLIYIQAAYI